MRTSSKCRLLGRATVMIAVVLGTCVLAPVTSPPVAADVVDRHVQVEPTGTTGVVRLDFDSQVLGRRVTNLVYLPAAYSGSGAPIGTLYYLHGTVFTATDQPELGPYTELEAILDMTSTGGGFEQTELFNFHAASATAQFVVVAPDTDPSGSWCHTCLWIDPRSGVTGPTIEPTPSEGLLYDELLPVVEETFNVRNDPGGRGLLGFSMGAWGALLNGMRHPDLFSFVGAVSGPIDTVDDVPMRAANDIVGYVRSQGWGASSVTDEVNYRNFDPEEIAENLAAADAKVLVTVGNGCVGILDLLHQDCPLGFSPVASAFEVFIKRNTLIGVPQLEDAGVDVDLVQRPGVHGSNNDTVFAADVVPMVNDVFDDAYTVPTTTSYRTADPSFEVWGYSVEVDRPAPAFLTLADARTDGESFSLVGVGNVEVRSPPVAAPSAAVDVTVTCPGSAAAGQATADGAGRVAIEVDLGTASRTCHVELEESV